MSKVCRTCLQVLNSEDACISLDSDGGCSYPSLRNKLSVCVPELALDVIQYAVICSLCMDALNTSYLFKNRCLLTEQKILEFTHVTGCHQGPINVSDVAEFSKSNLEPTEEVNIDVKPIICDSQADSGDITEVKHELEIKYENEPNFQSQFLSNYGLMNKIPFNPELDVQIRNYHTNAFSYSNPANVYSGTNFYPCIYCSKNFDSVVQLEAHLAMHAMENRPLKCDLCERRFVRKDKLMLHMRIHTGEKPFECSECRRCFSRKDKLNNHMRTHTGEKPHQCILCQRCFSRKDKMNAHMKSQHWITLANLEITVVKHAENGTNVAHPTLPENLPKAQ